MGIRPQTRFRLLIVLAATLCFPTGAAAQERAVSPDWNATAEGGETVHLAERVAERPTILFFWATWCPYCKALMPHLQSIRLEYGDRVEIVALTIRDDDGDPIGYVRNAGYDFTLIVDGDAIAAQNDVHGTPGVLILNPDREVEFNLYRLPRIEPPDAVDASSNSRKAAYRAPYWAAAIRKALDGVIAEYYPDAR